MSRLADDRDQSKRPITIAHYHPEDSVPRREKLVCIKLNAGHNVLAAFFFIFFSETNSWPDTLIKHLSTIDNQNCAHEM